MGCIQIKPAGRRVLSTSSFWQILDNGRPVGWASGYQAALTKAAEHEARTAGVSTHARA